MIPVTAVRKNRCNRYVSGHTLQVVICYVCELELDWPEGPVVYAAQHKFVVREVGRLV